MPKQVVTLRKLIEGLSNKPAENKAVCFYHNDNDGFLARYLVEIFTKNDSNIYKVVDYVSLFIDDTVVQEGDDVYIVDLSINKADIDILEKILAKAKNVYWFDHHKSSLDIRDTDRYKSFDEKYGNLHSVIDMERSGAMITFNELFPYTDCPLIVKYVDDYDRWCHDIPFSKHFKLGTDAIPNKFDWLYIEYDMGRIIENGSIIEDYTLSVNNEDFSNNGYSITINNHKGIVMNKPGNSAVFGSFYDTADFAIMWCYKKGIYKYSVYSSHPEIDCSKIAKFFNPKGGGHKGAAGWTSEELIIHPDDSFLI